MNEALEATAKLYDEAAKELDRAARHCEVAARHFRDNLVPRGAAHAWAARGHMLEAQARLNEQAHEHAERSQVDSELHDQGDHVLGAGRPEVLRLVERPIPKPTTGEVHSGSPSPASTPRTRSHAAAARPASSSRIRRSCRTRTGQARSTRRGRPRRPPRGRTGLALGGAPGSPGRGRRAVCVVASPPTQRFPSRRPSRSTSARASTSPRCTAHRCLTLSEQEPSRLYPGALAGTDHRSLPVAPGRSDMPRSSSPAGPERTRSPPSAARRRRRSHERPGRRRTSTTATNTPPRTSARLAPRRVDIVVEDRAPRRTPLSTPPSSRQHSTVAM